MIELKNGVLFETVREESDELDPPVEREDYNQIRRDLEEAQAEIEALRMLLASRPVVSVLCQ